MTDIIVRLLEGTTNSESIMEEAAQEIERLRAALREIADSDWGPMSPDGEIRIDMARKALGMPPL